MEGSGAALDQEWPVHTEQGPLATPSDSMDTCEAPPMPPVHPDAEETDETQEWESVACWDVKEAQASWEVVELEELLCTVMSASSSGADAPDDWTVL